MRLIPAALTLLLVLVLLPSYGFADASFRPKTAATPAVHASKPVKG
jgi:hypothetical protein